MSSIEELRAFALVYNSKSNSEQELWKKTITNKKQVLSKNVSSCISMCNSVLDDIAKNISNNFPSDPILTTYSGVISSIITNKPEQLISMFIISIYKNDSYRVNILLENDDFFISNKYEELKDNSDIDIMFKFKKYWKDMNGGLQDYVKKSMKTLVKIAEKYIESIGDMQDITELEAKIKN